MLKARTDGVFHSIQTQIHLFDGSAHSSDGRFEKVLGDHSFFDTLKAFANPLDCAGDKADQVFVRLGH